MFKLRTVLSFLFFFVLGFIFYPNVLVAQSNVDTTDKVLVEVLGRPDCSHCVAEKEFLEQLSEQRNDFVYNIYNIYLSDDKQLWEKITDLQSTGKVTPITIIGNDILVGFGSAENTGKQIEYLIDKNKGSPQITASDYISINQNENTSLINSQGTCDESGEEDCKIEPSPLLITIPLIGTTIDARQYSLPVLSATLGFVDGFNPCAMWVLVSFLVILAQLGSKRKMWLFAGVFILAEAIMYTLILTVWFTTWDFVGLDKYVTPLVGLVAIGGGIFFLYEWWTSDGSCKVTNLKQRGKMSSRIKDLASKPFTWVTFVGIILLAFSVNVIEFACSIGIPQAFTKILELNQLNLIQSSTYIFIYILMYMVDDFIVFGIALWSFEKIGITSKYSKLSNLIGGILMIVLGSLLIFKPEWLMVV